MTNGVSWSAYDDFTWADNLYLPPRGEGETMASQAVTAVAKLVYKWYNDGDVFDNTHYMQGWCNDLSSYANWLYRYVPRTRVILDTFVQTYTDSEYEQLLWELTNAVETQEHLAELNAKEKVGSIYECDGPFEFDENYGDEEDY